MGVVQLFNKISPEENNQVSIRDKEELDCILTSLGEIVRSAAQKFDFTKLCNNLTASLIHIQDEFNTALEKEFI